MYAIGYSDSVMIGSTRPPLCAPLAGKSGTWIVKINKSSVPIIKEGIDTNAVVMTMMILSISLFLRRAATAPSTMPKMPAITAAITPSFTDVFMPSKITSTTIRPLCFREGPKSNFVTMSFRYVAYCSRSGLSSPYFASSAFCADAVIAFSLMNGPPGTACMTKNVTVMTIQTVRIASRILFRM